MELTLKRRCVLEGFVVGVAVHPSGQSPGLGLLSILYESQYNLYILW